MNVISSCSLRPEDHISLQLFSFKQVQIYCFFLNAEMLIITMFNFNDLMHANCVNNHNYQPNDLVPKLETSLIDWVFQQTVYTIHI